MTAKKLLLVCLHAEHIFFQEYLSSIGIVHRDLACRNILVDEGKVLKITDFGMSRETEEIYVQKSKGRVPFKWMAMESIFTREFTSASDVWSYGIVLWEIGTLGRCMWGDRPFFISLWAKLWLKKCLKTASKWPKKSQKPSNPHGMWCALIRAVAANYMVPSFSLFLTG